MFGKTGETNLYCSGSNQGLAPREAAAAIIMRSEPEGEPEKANANARFFPGIR